MKAEGVNRAIMVCAALPTAFARNVLQVGCWAAAERLCAPGSQGRLRAGAGPA
jgi:hypothetical protein